MCPLLFGPNTSTGRWTDHGFSSEFEITLKLHAIRADLLNCQKAFILLKSAQIHCTCILLLVSILIIYVLLRVKLLVKKYEPRLILALWLAWVGTYTVNSAFNESVCPLSCVVMFDRPKNSILRPLPGVNQSQDFFLSSFFFSISRKNRYV